jgi:hypothetical protein
LGSASSSFFQPFSKSVGCRAAFASFRSQPGHTSVCFDGKGKAHFIYRKDVPFFAAFGLVYALFAFSGLSSITFDTPIPVNCPSLHAPYLYCCNSLAHSTGKGGGIILFSAALNPKIASR